ncbi:MAG: DsrE family protein [Thiohalophilus sp.]|jgi:intracellular sulfur oxidation DsrE/DsrF family protein
MSPAAADQDHHPRNNYSCPDDYFGQTYIMANGTVVENPDKTIDQEFGAGAEVITHCLSHRKHAKVLVAINGAHPMDKNGIAQTQKARFLSNIEYMRENYEVVHDMKIGEDVKVVAVASNSGALLMTTYHPAWMRDSDDGSTDCPMKPVPGKTCANPFRELVERAQSYGVKFYLCQMASRVLGIKMANKIPGVKFVPGGHIAVADFQMDGYALIDL